MPITKDMQLPIEQVKLAGHAGTRKDSARLHDHLIADNNLIAEMLAALIALRGHVGLMPTIDAQGEDCFLQTARVVHQAEAVIAKAKWSARRRNNAK